ncbi:DNA repair protein complementing XP-A cells -like protein [Trichinella nelsoni]|uniref:DNA repair protein complementing XP-A cells-like protein n=1 Tax=Trichinella nelsoni TaxID=6336 RepID=A0A0V0RN04_9BILA|nr:DNA repair protein complementing XP-A cells -like protein [Trichinella nelsoni]
MRSKRGRIAASSTLGSYPTVEELYSHGDETPDKTRLETIELVSVSCIICASQPSYSNAGGFFIESDEQKFESSSSRSSKRLPDFSTDSITETKCVECSKEFDESYLHSTFNYPVCDQCKELKGKHSLITRTKAKELYLLKDCDFDLRAPPLRFAVRKNPHSARYGDMKLYLTIQVEKRAIEVWGSVEELERQRQLRLRNREKWKEKRYDNKMRNLRKQVQSGVHVPKTHQHNFGDEQFDKKNNSYFKNCIHFDRNVVLYVLPNSKMKMHNSMSAILSITLSAAVYIVMQCLAAAFGISKMTTILCGFAGANIFVFILTAISNVEMHLYGKNYQARFFPEVFIAMTAAAIASLTVHRICMTIW